MLRSLLFIVVLTGGSLGVAALLYRMRTEAPRRELDAPPPIVDSITLELETITERFLGYGSAEAHLVVNIAAENSARVVEIVDRIRAGSIVVAGQPLVRLDDRDYAASLLRVEALVRADRAAIEEVEVEAISLKELMVTAEEESRLARNEWVRVSDLFEQHNAAKKEYDFANLAYQQARRILQGYELEASKLGPRERQLRASLDGHKAEVQQAQLRIERCELRAPFSGSIRSLAVEVGDWVGVGAAVLSVIDPSRVEIAIQLPAATYEHVAVGAACRLESESMPGVVWNGRVARVAPSVDESTRTYSAFVEVDNSAQDQPCVPGTFVRAIVEGPTHEDVIVIPRSAIRDGYVVVSVDGEARRRSVSVDRLIGDRALITGALSVGDRLILSHLSRLAEGTRVRLHSRSTLTSQGVAPSSVNGRGITP